MNKSTRFALSGAALAVLSTFSAHVLSHSENAQPRYVAPNGVDQGKCDQMEQPCATVTYAGSQANKGDEILMVAGNYLVNDANGLFYMLSGIVPIKPGFSAATEFKVQDTHGNATYLTGVPLELAAQLRRKGFKVNTDKKMLAPAERKALDQKLAQFAQLRQAQSNEACVNGQAAGFSCNNIDLLAHVPLSQLSPNSASSGNDIWGFVDLNTHKEYAIMGLNNGISVIDVTTPTAPVVIGSIAAASTLWRDVKVHQVYDHTALRWKSHAYVTTDGASVGLMIIDLTDLPQSVSSYTVDTTDSSAHNVFISGVDYSTGVAKTNAEARVQVAGASNGQGALKSFAINDDASVSVKYRPGAANNPGYTHDIAGINIDDDRVGTQCTGVDGQCEILFDFNEKEAKIWDSSDISTPQLIGEVKQNQFVNPQYIHSGWTTEDNKVLIVHDELDEGRNNTNTKVQFFDISDLTNPQPLAVWEGPDGSIDHNGYVRGNRYYMSNYASGLTVLDLTDPANPQTVGYFDTYPLNNNVGFTGAWGVYPFLPSGNILVSDMDSGLYILKDNTVGKSTDDSVKLSQPNYQIDEGESLSVTISRSGNNAKAVTVQYETQIGSAGVDDFSMVSGTLSWAAGDSSDKTIDISAVLDFIDDELNEDFVIRLFNPTSGLSLTAPNVAVVNIKGVPVPPFVGFSAEDVEAKETDGVLQIAVNRGGDLDEAITVNYSATAGDATLDADFSLAGDSLSWGAGDNSTQFIELNLIDDADSEANEQVVLTLEGQSFGISETTITIRDDESNQPPQVTIGEDITVNQGETISLTAIASDPEGYELSYQWTQSAGTDVTLSNDTASSASTIAPSVAGTLTFEVAVTDDFGVSTTAAMNVTVNEATTEPVPMPIPPSNNSSGGGSLGIFSLLALGLGFGRRKLGKR